MAKEREDDLGRAYENEKVKVFTAERRCRILEDELEAERDERRAFQVGSFLFALVTVQLQAETRS